jgi:hypothetical protein
MYKISDYPKENRPPPSIALAHMLNQAGAAQSRFMAALPPLQVRNEWLVRAIPKIIKATKISANPFEISSTLAALKSRSVIETQFGNPRAVACQQRTEKCVVAGSPVNSESSP